MKIQVKEGWFVGKEFDGSDSWMDGESRGLFYSFLSAVFNDEVSVAKIADFLRPENSGQLEKSLELIPEDKSARLQEGIKELKQRWGGHLGDEEKENLDLRREFAYLFLTPHGVHPYESIYRGKKKLLMDKPWEEVRKFYRSIGIEKDKSQMHPEDHIAVELGFMATLAYMSGRFLLEEENTELVEEERRDMLKAQYSFLEQHLSKWVPQLCNDIAEKARHPFYRSVAELTAEFVRADLSCLQDYFTNDKFTEEGR